MLETATIYIQIIIEQSVYKYNRKAAVISVNSILFKLSKTSEFTMFQSVGLEQGEYYCLSNARIYYRHLRSIDNK